MERSPGIARVGTAARSPETFATVDGAGKYLMPGLADLHVHLEYSDDPRVLDLFHANGVTTVRNMDGRPYILERRDRIARGEWRGPTIHTAGPILDGDPPLRDDNLAIGSAADARKAVRNQASAGYDFIKVYTAIAPRATVDAWLATPEMRHVGAARYPPESGRWCAARGFRRRRWTRCSLRSGRAAGCTEANVAIHAESAQTMTRAFCVGQAKSGTASLAGMLSTNYRAAHEPERQALLEMILRESQGAVSSQGFRDYLLERDARFDLEYDISWANQFVVGHLLAAFPAAKFIVLVRDCNSWLKSLVGHLASRDMPPDVLAFLKWWFQPERYPHSRHDRALETNGLFSVPAYLHAWNRHVDLCARAIPTDRRLVLRTHELVTSRRRLATFLQILEESIDIDNGHLNRTTWSGVMESLVDQAYLDEKIRAICAASSPWNKVVGGLTPVEGVRI